MRVSRRECLAGLTTFVVAGCKVAPATQVSARQAAPAPSPAKKGGGDSEAPLQTFTPENFGAAGDGQTNDTDAFARMTAAVNAVGGGTVLLQPVTYIVGGHVPDPTSVYAFAPAPIMTFDGCKALNVLGNGARLRCADGLRFGTFDPLTGLPTQHSLPYYGTGELASPYVAMICAQNCSGKVYVEHLELDGNIDGLLIGGPRGDTGWQISASGLLLVNNSGAEHIVDVHSHHHALDGIQINGLADRATAALLEKVVSEYNVRQGCSIVGGRNYSFSDCKFNHTGKGRMTSAPSAGVDIEAESSPIRNLAFSSCEFSNNSGAGLVADSGDSADASFEQCRFIGTTSWSAWPRKPEFRFTDCAFIGSIVNAYGDPDPELAAHFENCTFSDDPALSPTGEVYKSDAPIADLSDNANILFDHCTISLGHAGLLPWSTKAIYSDCVMAQSATTQAYPRGTFTGTNRIDGNVDLYGSTVMGQLTVNGQLVPNTV